MLELHDRSFSDFFMNSLNPTINWVNPITILGWCKRFSLIFHLLPFDFRLD